MADSRPEPVRGLEASLEEALLAAREVGDRGLARLLRKRIAMVRDSTYPLMVAAEAAIQTIVELNYYHGPTLTATKVSKGIHGEDDVMAVLHRAQKQLEDATREHVRHHDWA